jgi:carboxymethylenebutenolidase
MGAGMHTHMVSVARPRADAPAMQAYVASPDGAGPFPGVLIIHEIFGLTDDIREVARRFADAGYVGLAIDLFANANRATCLARAFAGLLVRPLHNGMLSDAQAALSALRAQPGVEPRRVGAIGFCMGGGYALQLACVDDSLRVASVFYATNPRPLSAVERACPIVGSYPGRDYTARGARSLAATLQRAGIPHDIKIYPGTLHAFFNPQGKTYNAQAAEDGWARTLSFFSQHLAPAPSATH